ncbi:hypothetical protein ANCCAN_01860 [Ancylostoma caninum]|uniref:Uncharacterized protein n=1 Tax=Ancylostoma caninum TaxID=29170 RepID=A0A368H650_ANCCA|nr:hypothetical protein ANCCAN_01860 [Ancylostoma caninum]
MTFLVVGAACFTVSLPYRFRIRPGTDGVILYGFTLTRYLMPRHSGCDVLPSLLGCFFMRLPLNISMFMVARFPGGTYDFLIEENSFSSTTMIAIERSLSTAKLSNYEENRRIGPVLVILQIAFVGCLCYVLYFNTVFSGRVIYYCLATTVGSPWFSYVPFGTLILLQISAVIILYILKNINRKIAANLREHPDLRARYNVDENLRTITIVFPFCAATCLFTSCFFSLLICVIAINASLSYSTLFTLIDGSLLLPEFALILPLIIDRMTKIVAEKKQVAFQRHINTTVDCVGSSYLSTLAYAWNEPKEENKTNSKHLVGLKTRSSRKP